MDTIFALASARGKAGVSIVRVSGPAVEDVCRALIGGVPPPRRAVLRSVETDRGIIDHAICLFFNRNQSFTGEETVEFQTHGSPAVVAALTTELSALPGLRPAEPGEFTRRALENDRLDLAQIEGLADLIDAETEAQRIQAMRVFEGAIGRLTDSWREKLIRAAALLEAAIDFADEDVPVDVFPEVRRLITDVRADLEREVAGSAAAERVREGFEVAIVGPPNVGKSTLLNRLAGREAAITSEIAGTTRDVVEVRMDIDGLAVTLLDTAGIREAADSIEAIGVDRARQRARQADLRVVLTDGPESQAVIEPMPDDIVVSGKRDLHGSGLSGLTGDGVDDLIDRISQVLSTRSVGAGIAIRERHAIAMRTASAYLAQAEASLDCGAEELVAEELRSAASALDALTGRIGVEDLLGEIFSRFCIGK